MNDQKRREEDGMEVWLSENSTAVFKWVLGLALAAFIVVAIAYFGFFLAPPLNVEPDKLGQAGDYFGGILNPVFGFLSVFALLVALVLQTRELRLSRESLKLSAEELRLSREEQAKAAGALAAQNRAIQRQSFEQTFFSWLGSYGERLDEIVMITNHESGAQMRGRPLLHHWWRYQLSARYLVPALEKQIDATVWKRVLGQAANSRVHVIQLLPPDAKGLVTTVALRRWDELYREHQFHLDSLFRDLYRLILWVDSQRDENLSSAQKWLYVSIVRGKLSWIELVYLFLNAQTPRGASFKRLLEKYAILDNLTFESDNVLALLKEYPEDKVGFLDAAYCSITARRALALPDSAEEVLALASAI